MLLERLEDLKSFRTLSKLRARELYSNVIFHEETICQVLVHTAIEYAPFPGIDVEVQVLRC